ncbi:phage tail protein I [Amycolatopsis sp. SID8362]|uniref:phage tail protein I n=1 Tax=Amycolatopsis sp. SID8362 TaxID=2690346 RepID=UPI00136B7DB5|nr:phage tail protein I [Amycolatopsis sp. SID8362]NBH06062.1 phage tail protein I [Amycolatopsis sp. SID8362]NED42761.1 phage tail protein I [Amycolatopsis sp. SID8362]
MRAAIPGVQSPYPLMTLLPAVLREDQFLERWTAGLDEVLVPIISTIDCLPAYFDPRLAPDDFVRWLAGWFGVVLDESWPVSSQRSVIAEAVELYRMRGTVTGLRRHLDVVVDGRIEIEESGGTAWSQRPTPPAADDLRRWVTVRVTPNDPATFSRDAVEAVVRAAKPVDVVHRLVVMAK